VVCTEGAKRLMNEDLEGMIGRGAADPCCSNSSFLAIFLGGGGGGGEI
jgi:hypothetical protein